MGKAACASPSTAASSLAPRCCASHVLAKSGRLEKARLDETARKYIEAARAYVDANFMRDDAPLMYSFNTGVGLCKHRRVLMAEMAEHQRRAV